MQIDYRRVIHTPGSDDTFTLICFVFFVLYAIGDGAFAPTTPSAAARPPRKLTMRMNTLITNNHARKTRTNQSVRLLLTSSTNANA